MIIIGITGTIGAGKGTIVDYLVERYGFKHFSVRDYLLKEVEKRKIAVNRDSLVLVANDLRATHSPSFITDELYKEAVKQTRNAVIESIRTPGEIKSLKKNGNFILLAIDAKPELRYDRIVKRNSETDHVSYAVFLENEQREMNSSDPNKQNLSKCIAEADYLLENNSDFVSLHNQIDLILDKIIQNER